jgi:hypothetical protein
MSEPKAPASYIEKLLFAQRVVRSARFRNDQKMAVRELSEGVYELITALVEREQGRETPPDPGGAPQELGP